MSNQIDFLMEEYKRLGVSEAEAATAIKNLLGTTMARNEQARSERFSPGVTGFLGAASGFLRPGTNAADGYSKAMDAYQTRQETDPFVDQTMIGGYLNTERKEINDLRAKVLGQMKERAANGSDVPFETKVFGTNVLVTDRRNGVVTVVASDQVPQYQKAFGRYYDTLKEQGGYTPTEMSTLAQERALHEIRTGNSLMQVLPNQPVAGKVSVPATSDMSATPTLPVNTTSTTPDYQALDIAQIDKELSRPGISEPTKKLLTENKNRLLQQTPPAYAGTPRYDESIKKMDKNIGINHAVPSERRVMTGPQIAENAKEVTKLQESNQNLRNSNFSLNNMENTSLAIDPKTGKLATSQGPASELITKMGGWTNYFAPESILALQAGNNAAFFSSMQGQVRSILPAYGSGTAVSNLDLIVGQLAAGSLDNTLQGRLQIIGASKAMNKAMEIINESKRKHLADGGSLADFRMPDEALVGLAPVRKLIDGKTYMRYEPITKDQFIDRLKAKNPKQFEKASKEEIAKEWNDFALKKGNYEQGK